MSGNEVSANRPVKHATAAQRPKDRKEQTQATIFYLHRQKQKDTEHGQSRHPKPPGRLYEEFRIPKKEGRRSQADRRESMEKIWPQQQRRHETGYHYCGRGGVKKTLRFHG